MKLRARDKELYVIPTIFPGEIVVFFSRVSMDKVYKAHNLGPPEWGQGFGGVALVTKADGSRKYFVYIDLEMHKARKEPVWRTATHEAVHISQYVQEHIGTKFDIETEAYFIEYVSKQIELGYQDIMKLEKK